MEIGLKLFGHDGSFPGFRRATTRACLHSLGKRCVLAHALKRKKGMVLYIALYPVRLTAQSALHFEQAQYPLRCYGSEVLDLLSQDFVESSSFPVFQML